MLILAILSISILVNLLLALFVILNNPKSATHRNFFMLTLAFISYGLINYISLHPIWLAQITWIRLDLLAAVYLFLFLYLTYSTFPDKKTSPQGLIGKSFIVYSIIVSVLVMTPAVFSGLETSGNSVQPMPAPGIPFFVIQQVAAVILTGRMVRRKYRQSGQAQKKQLNLVVAGTTIAVLTILGFNLIAVQVFKTTALIPFSSLGVLAFTLTFSYSLIKYRFLNVRLLVARSLGYLMSLSLLVIIYSAFTEVLLHLIRGESLQMIILTNTILLMLVILTYQPLKNFFDRQTNKIFYRDAYDPQSFLDELNKTIVGNIEMGILLRHSSSVIGNNIKAECHIYIKSTETVAARLLGTTVKHIKPEDITLINEELATISDKTVVTSDLQEHYKKLRSVLENNDIAVISRMITSYTDKQEATAYLILGPKKSGNAYSKQDLRIINIITDELLIAIQNALRFEEIQSFNITLQKRINEATAKLKRSNDKLKEMDETKDEFISMASHQLRTPLTSVKGYLSMVLEGDAGKVPENQKQLLNQAYISAQRMVYLIADLLNVSRLKTGKFIIDATPTDLVEMVESEISQLSEVAKSRKISLEFNQPKEFPLLSLDETKTRQVVMNFIDNAIYYTPSGGKIKVELKTDRYHAYFLVKDNGLGVPKDEQPHLFTKFYRAKNAQKARPDGTGLGLFMAKKVISEQGGSILFESTEGKGSTFGFKFKKPAKSA